MSEFTSDLVPSIDRANTITVLTGAGMSAESGIPTFRGDRNGLWARFDPMALATPEAWRSDRDLALVWYLWRMAIVRRAQPNAGHLAFARLARHKTVSVVTQNVDDLHERTGSQDVVQLHGELFASRCDRFGRPARHEIPDAAADAPMLRRAAALRWLRRASATGCCVVRGGVADRRVDAAVAAVESCDLLLVSGHRGSHIRRRGCRISQSTVASAWSRSIRARVR